MSTAKYWMWLLLVHFIAWMVVYLIYGLADWEAGNRLLVPFLMGGLAFSIGGEIGDYYRSEQRKTRR